MFDSNHVPFTVGSHGGYDWLVTEDYLSDVLRLNPEVIVGKFLAVTSFDSGHLVLRDEEAAKGWSSEGEIAYSPRIQATSGVPRDGWDEWYVFDQPFRLGRLLTREENPFDPAISDDVVRVFVNMNMGLHRPNEETLTSMFWNQLERLHPQTFIAESDYHLTFVTSDKELFAAVHDGMRRLDEVRAEEAEPNQI